jgi:endonuclease YncB( thermonuclease family)
VTVWTVPATVLRVVDGDTLMLHLDLGWHISYEARCRLIGVNAPELDTDAGVAARLWVIDRLDSAGVYHLNGDSLGQVLVSTPQGESFDLGLELLHAGHAVPMS